MGPPWSVSLLRHAESPLPRGGWAFLWAADLPKPQSGGWAGGVFAIFTALPVIFRTSGVFARTSFYNAQNGRGGLEQFHKLAFK